MRKWLLLYTPMSQVDGSDPPAYTFDNTQTLGTFDTWMEACARTCSLWDTEDMSGRMSLRFGYYTIESSI